MARNLRFFLIGVVFTGALLILCTQTFGQYYRGTKVPQSNDLELVIYPSGLTAFFNHETGKLYVYDSQIEECLMIRQLVAPGKKMKRQKPRL